MKAIELNTVKMGLLEITVSFDGNFRKLTWALNQVLLRCPILLYLLCELQFYLS
jgi:hypothetical protein